MTTGLTNLALRGAAHLATGSSLIRLFHYYMQHYAYFLKRI